MTGTATSLVCAGCGTVPPPPEKELYPFRCTRAGRGDGDHVVRRVVNTFKVEFARGDDPNPFIRHRELLHSYHAARRRGLADAAYVDLVRRLDDAVAGVDGHGFRTTPFGRNAALSERLGFDAAGGVWVKDETGNVSGSHKGRHLMGILLYLQVVERRERPPLAIASCGNAALAAAVLARAAGRPLRVFVPPNADPNVLERLGALGADIATCLREPGARGDPCMLRFREAVREGEGALPFCCQGTENGLTIEGGETLAYEMIAALGGTALDHVVIQVGGGALASACIQASTLAARAGWVKQTTRFHTVQTSGAWPLKRAYDRIADRMVNRMRVEATAPALAPGDDRARAELIEARFVSPLVQEEFRYAARHRSEFMWPWEEEPRSVARGILDDETYDWLAVVRGMLATGGYPIVVAEETLLAANALARETTGSDVDHTGSAGLAGLLELRASGALAPGEKVAIIFTGSRR